MIVTIQELSFYKNCKMAVCLFYFQLVMLNQHGCLFRWQQLLINRLVGYDTILMNSLLDSPGQGINCLLGLNFILQFFTFLNNKFRVIFINFQNCHTQCCSFNWSWLEKFPLLFIFLNPLYLQHDSHSAPIWVTHILCAIYYYPPFFDLLDFMKISKFLQCSSITLNIVTLTCTSKLDDLQS